MSASLLRPADDAVASGGPRLLPFAAHLLVALWLFREAVFGRHDLFFRDIGSYSYPNYVFLARSLAQGVWPLWDPANDAGSPFFVGYPLDLLLVALTGARWALKLGPPLHVFLAMCGATLLARRFRTGDWGAWAAGAFYGLSGYLLSSVNLLPLLHAATWAPWVASALLAFLAQATPRRAALLAAVVATQVSTLSAETVIQTTLLAVALLPRLPRGREWALLCGAGVVLALLLTPVVFGAWAVLEGTQRAHGFRLEEAFSWSATPLVLLESLVPRLFGNVHTFSDLGYWGQPFFFGGYPYLLSLYLGPTLLLVALKAGRGSARLWLLAALGVLLSLGQNGPLAGAMTPLMRSFRTPIKFFLLTNLSLCLLAGFGLESLRGRHPERSWFIVPGALLISAALLLVYWPDLPGRLFGKLLPEILDERARFVIRSAWPAAFASTGAMVLVSGIVLGHRARLAPVAAVLALADLLAMNSGINPTAAAFYELRPAVVPLIRQAAEEGTYRWFSYGASGSHDLVWSPAVAVANIDVALYAMDRQSLLPRAHVLEGLEGALDEDRTGSAPDGSTLMSSERTPGKFRAHRARLRLANVRWVLSFRGLPSDLVALRGQIHFPEVMEPLGLYELIDPVPRVFVVSRHEVQANAQQLRRRIEQADFDPRSTVLLDAEPAATPASPAVMPPAVVSYERIDPHTVRLRVSGPAGYLVVLEGYHRGWRATGPAGDLPLLRAYGRYWAIPTSGGEQELWVRYEPRWRGPALAAAALGAALGLIMVAKGGPKPVERLDSAAGPR